MPRKRKKPIKAPKPERRYFLGSRADPGPYHDLTSNNHLALLLEEREALRARKYADETRDKQITEEVKMILGDVGGAILPDWRVFWVTAEIKPTEATTRRWIIVERRKPGDPS